MFFYLDEIFCNRFIRKILLILVAVDLGFLAGLIGK